jgi:ketosteroid isomerase-like protein
MKRSEALAPLSRDHHVALVVAAVLERADREGIDAAAARFVEFLTAHELSHFAQEEALLLPAVGDDDTGRALVARVLDDHAYLRDALERLRRADAPKDLGFVHEVGARLRAHVRMEEREFFPYLERTLDPAALEEIGSRLAAEPADDPGEVVRSFLDAFIARDLEGLLALADPEVELHPLRLTGTPAYRGHEGVRRWLEELEQRAADVSFAVEQVRAHDRTRAIARVRVLAAGQELTVTAIFTVVGGTIREVHGYFSDEELLAEVGHL